MNAIAYFAIFVFVRLVVPFVVLLGLGIAVDIVTALAGTSVAISLEGFLDLVEVSEHVQPLQAFAGDLFA